MKMGQKQTSLLEAVQANNIKKVRAVLRTSVDVNAIKNGQTALFAAVCASQYDISSELLLHGADVNVVCQVVKTEGDHMRQFDWTAIHETCRSGNVEMLNLLLAYGGYVDSTAHDGISPLHVASWHGHIQVMITLIDKGCDVNKLDSYCESAIVFPITRGDTKVVRLLLEAGCKYNSYTWSSRSIRVQSDVYYSSYQELEAIEGVPGPHSLFIHAIHCGWVHIAILLLQHGFSHKQYTLEDILCVSSKSNLNNEQIFALIRALLSAGYVLTLHDQHAISKVTYFQKYVRRYYSVILWLEAQVGHVPSLKQAATVSIRKTLQTLYAGLSIFSRIDQLPLPAALKNIVRLKHIEVPSSQVMDYPFYFHKPQNVAVSQRQNYMQFWINACCMRQQQIS